MKILLNKINSKESISLEKLFSHYKSNKDIEFEEKNLNIKQLKLFLDKNNVDIVFIIGCNNDEKIIEQLEIIRKTKNGISFVIEVSKPNSSFLLKCIEMKFDDIISDFKIPAIIKKIDEKVLQHEQFLHTKIHEKKIVSFISSKGGDGSSFLSSNFAYALSLDQTKKVILIDLSFPISSCDMYLTEKESLFNVYDFTEALDRIDSVLINSMVNKLKINLHLIPAGNDYQKLLNMSADDLDMLLNILMEYYDFIILDLGTSFDPGSLGILQKSNDIFMNVSDNILSIRNCSTKLSIMEMNSIDLGKLHIVKNNIFRNEQISSLNISQAIDKNISFELRYEPEILFNCLNLNESLFQSKNKSENKLTIQNYANKYLGNKYTGSSIWNNLKKINIFDS